MIPVEWRDIPSCPGYEASNDGRIRRKAYELAQSDMNGYKIVCPGGRDKNTPIGVHRLVVEAFRGTKNLVVNHKDGNRSNNNLDNLVYATYSENTRHARAVLGKQFGFKKGLHSGKQPVKVIASKEGVDVGTYRSLSEASVKLKVPQSGISNCLNGKLKTSLGYSFRRTV